MSARTAVIGELVGMAHPRAVVIFSALVVVVAMIAEHGAPPLAVSGALVLAMASVQVGVGVLNDYCDRDLDAIAKPDRALPAGLVRPRSALALGCAAIVLGLGVAATLGLASVSVLALGAAMGVAYSTSLKRSFFSWVPYAVAYPIVPIWVWVTLGRLRPELLVVLVFGIPISLGVHLCNQLRDYEEDVAQGMRGFAQYLGRERAADACIALLLVGPAIALWSVRSGSIGPLVALAVAASAHSLLVLCAMLRTPASEADRWKTLFRRLQLTVPSMLVAWLAATAR